MVRSTVYTVAYEGVHALTSGFLLQRKFYETLRENPMSSQLKSKIGYDESNA